MISQEDLDKLEDAFMDVLVHLIAATSAYETFAGNSERRSVRDALYKTRLHDFHRAIERGRAVLK